MFAAPGFEILIIAGVWSLVAGAAAGGVINCDGGRWQPLDTQARDRELTVSCQERALLSGSGPPPPPPCSLQLQHGRNTEMIYLLSSSIQISTHLAQPQQTLLVARPRDKQQAAGPCHRVQPRLHCQHFLFSPRIQFSILQDS